MKIILSVIRALLFVLHLSAGMLIAGLLFHRRNRDYHQHKSVIRLWLKLCALIFGCRIQFSSDHQQPATDIEGSLFVANHISWLDILVLGGIFNVRFLSKSEIRGWPFFGWLSVASGTLFIERGRGSETSNDSMTGALQQGDNVLIFPEGTTTDGISVKPFHPRLFKSAISAQQPVTPVMISYLTRHQPIPTLPGPANAALVQPCGISSAPGARTFRCTVLPRKAVRWNRGRNWPSAAISRFNSGWKQKSTSDSD